MIVIFLFNIISIVVFIIIIIVISVTSLVFFHFISKVKVLAPTITNKISETNSSFHVKERTTGKV